MGEVIANSPTPGVSAQLTTLGAAITTTGQTSITTAAAATGNLLEGNFRAIIGDGTQNSGAYEIVLVTAGQSGTTWTIARGVEGSTAATWNNATPIYHVWTQAGIANAIPIGLPMFAPYPGAFVMLPYTGPPPGNSTLLLTNGTILYLPLIILNSPTVSAISMQVTTGGSSGAVLRYGIFNDANGEPGSVLLDCGTVAAVTNANTASVTGIGQALTPGRYWVGAVAQGSPVTAPTVRTSAGADIMPTVSPDTLAHAMLPDTYCGYTQTGVTGALGSPSGFAVQQAVSGTGVPMVVVSF